MQLSGHEKSRNRETRPSGSSSHIRLFRLPPEYNIVWICCFVNKELPELAEGTLLCTQHIQYHYFKVPKKILMYMFCYSTIKHVKKGCSMKKLVLIGILITVALFSSSAQGLYFEVGISIGRAWTSIDGTDVFDYLRESGGNIDVLAFSVYHLPEILHHYQ